MISKPVVDSLLQRDLSKANSTQAKPSAGVEQSAPAYRTGLNTGSIYQGAFWFQTRFSRDNKAVYAADIRGLDFVVKAGAGGTRRKTSQAKPAAPDEARQHIEQ